VFDCLQLDGRDLTKLKLVERKEILKSILPESDIIKYCDHVEAEGIALFEQAHQVFIGAASAPGHTEVQDVAAIGRLSYPSLRPAYGLRFSTGVISATGVIDVLIPPSVGMILYSISAEQSVPQLFIAGVLPGLMLAALYALYVLYYVRKHDIRDSRPSSLKNFVAVTRSSFWALGAPAVILGGIYAGIFSPLYEWRSGFPWSAVNEFQDFVGPRNESGRLPRVSTLDFTLSRPWRFRKYRFLAGIKIYNTFRTGDERDVQANVTSPDYGTFYNPIHRSIGFVASASRP